MDLAMAGLIVAGTATLILGPMTVFNFVTRRKSKSSKE